MHVARNHVQTPWNKYFGYFKPELLTDIDMEKSIAEAKEMARSLKDRIARRKFLLQPTRDSGQAPLNRISKIKRGLSGFVNGLRKSAIADTCAARNVVSAAYAKELKLQIEDSPSLVKLGNSKKTQSIGTICKMLPMSYRS